jgi:hypothetical protein
MPDHRIPALPAGHTTEAVPRPRWTPPMYDDRSHDDGTRSQPTVAGRRTAAERRAARQQQDLRAGLTPEQLRTVETMEAFQWRLAFVRRPLFRDPIPVMFDRGDTRFVVVQADGTLDENPTLKLRG